MNRRNYQKELDAVIAGLAEDGKAPSLLIHSCCAPCSSYVIEYLSQFFRITIFYYNPNIFPEQEYHFRAEEQRRLIQELPVRYPVQFLEGDYIPQDFYRTVRGLEHVPEGGERCFACYRLRLQEAALMAQKTGCSYFATTLSISPLKNAEKLNEIGEALASEYGVRWLPNDFKKKNGYQRSIELSRKYGLYRQDYCGCSFSYRERHPKNPDSME